MLGLAVLYGITSHVKEALTVLKQEIIVCKAKAVCFGGKSGLIG